MAWRLSGPVVHDSTQMPALLQAIASPIREIYADKGYLSNANCVAARMSGATPYIRPKKNTRKAPAKPSGFDHRTPFQQMVGAEQTDPDAWYARYCRRNRIESTFAAIKRRWGGRVRAINRFMCAVETQLKLLVWNLTRSGYA